jgi:putative Holliday junction resolvase
MIPATGRVLGIDLGAVRIGVAISDDGQTVASGLMVLTRSEDPAADGEALRRIVADEEAVGAVVGLPLSLDGTIGPAARGALDQAETLRRLLEPATSDRPGAGVETWDERFTTTAAAHALRAGGRRGRGQGRKNRKVVDEVAATILLQSWLDRRRSAG